MSPWADLEGAVRSYGSSNSHTMGCPPVHGDNPRALASGLSYVQLDKHGITIFITYISVDIAHHEIFRADVGKGGINVFWLQLFCWDVLYFLETFRRSQITYVDADQYPLFAHSTLRRKQLILTQIII